MIAMRCLGLLLIPTKTKESTGDIPFFMRFVPVSILIKFNERKIITYLIFVQNETSVKEAPEKGNNQPHLVIFNHDEYDQYFISIEQKLYLECKDVATAIFHQLGCHYVLNLSYHQKLSDLMRFIQEKIARVSSSHTIKWKSAVSTMHVNGISSEYEALKQQEENSDTDN